MTELLLNQRAGMNVSYIPQADGTFLIKHSMDGDDLRRVLDNNKALANDDDQGWFSPAKEMRRVAFIPPIVQLAWLNEGLDIHNPDHEAAFNRKLNSSEWQYLRTAPGRV